MALATTYTDRRLAAKKGRSEYGLPTRARQCSTPDSASNRATWPLRHSADQVAVVHLNAQQAVARPSIGTPAVQSVVRFNRRSASSEGVAGRE